MRIWEVVLHVTDAETEDSAFDLALLKLMLEDDSGATYVEIRDVQVLAS